MTPSSMQVAVQPEAVGICAHPPEDWARLAPVWADLYRLSGRASFFVSEDWVDTWMSVFGSSLHPSTLLFYGGEEVKGACLLTERRIRRALVPLRLVWLNTSGEDPGEATYPEFNNLVCRPGWEALVAAALARYLRAGEWDELHLAGFEPGSVFDLLRGELPELSWREEQIPSFYVDLAGIRQASGTFESVLGKTSRKHLRQNRRHYSGVSGLTLESPATAEAAVSMFDEMSEYNRQRRVKRGASSVFQAARFLEFHRRLIRRCFAHGNVQLIRVSAEGRTLGTVYLLQNDGKVYFYQCGFRFDDDARWSPGTLTVAEAIQRCLDSGYDEWDFLAGREDYKQRLSMGSRSLIWAAGHRRSPKMEIVDRLRILRRALQNVRAGRAEKRS